LPIAKRGTGLARFAFSSEWKEDLYIMSTFSTSAFKVATCAILTIGLASVALGGDAGGTTADKPEKGQNSDASTITQIEARDCGFTAIYLNTALPDEGCTRTDRAIIVASQDSENNLFSTATTAFIHEIRVFVRVEGCVGITPGSKTTAPLVIRIAMQRGY